MPLATTTLCLTLAAILAGATPRVLAAAEPAAAPASAVATVANAPSPPGEQLEELDQVESILSGGRVLPGERQAAGADDAVLAGIERGFPLDPGAQEGGAHRRPALCS